MLCGNTECSYCLEKSCFIYENIWSEENNLKSYEVFINANKKYSFICPECLHSYEQSPNTKTKGTGCPFCAKHFGKLCGDIECKTCLDVSAYCYKLIWAVDNKLKSHEVSINSNKKYKFNCLECKSIYEQTVNSKTQGSGCPFCKNKTELKVMKFLKDENIKFKPQFKFENDSKRYDFLLIDYNLNFGNRW
jgi:hypothetical protein